MEHGRTVSGAEETVISNLDPDRATSTKSLVGDDERKKDWVSFSVHHGAFETAIQF